MKEKDEIALILADTLVEMKPVWHQLFNVGGCDPHCHGCWKPIPVGAKFKLATIEKGRKIPNTAPDDPGQRESREVMLCATCKAEDVKGKREKGHGGMYSEGPGEPTTNFRGKSQKAGEYLGCYRVNGKIVP